MKTLQAEIKTMIPLYDVGVHGDIVTFDKIPDYVELERYWVNEPFSYISIQFNKTNDDYIYNVVDLY